MLQKFEIRFRSWNVGSFCGRGKKACEQLREKRICAVYRKSDGEGKNLDLLVAEVGYKLWWSGDNDRIKEVGILVKEKLCKKVIEVQEKK